MIQPPNKIQDAINAAEFVASPLKRDNEQVTISNRTLLTLIEAAKKLIQDPDDTVPWDD